MNLDSRLTKLEKAAAPIGRMVIFWDDGTGQFDGDLIAARQAGRLGENDTALVVGWKREH